MQSFEYSQNESGVTIKAALELDRAERHRNEQNAPSTEEVIATVQNATSTIKAQKSSAPIKVLWLDDNPDFNVRERGTLSALGFVFTLVKTTQEAKSLITGSNYDLIIADFKRDDDPEAGYGLLDHIMTIDQAPPYIIYASAVTPELVDEAINRGAFGETNRPSELVRLSVRAISSSAME
jgi:CheY-like chemotaxis protein